jgi:hypothetical protein
MRNRAFIAATVLLVLSSLAFGQPAYINFNYYFCPDDPPMTGTPCWQGTPIPDGLCSLKVYEYPATFLGTDGTFNGDVIGCGPGYFAGEPPITWFSGRQIYCVIECQGVTYSTVNHPYTTVVGDNAIETTQDWWDCSGGTECEPTESGCDGPYDIAQGSTQVFFASHDSCTARITASGGTAHGVSICVFDAVPQYHPVAYNYMSRVVAIYWNASVDPNTTLHVRMYYTNAELNESGFASSGCVIGARFDEFAANWSPVSATSGLKYIEFDTDRSGYYTFDCHAAAPRVVSMGDPKVASGDGELVLRWQTKDEFENYRFHVMRADRPEGPFAEIATVDSKLPNIMTVGSYDYEYRDSGLQNGRTYFFRLSSEDLHGNSAQPGITVSGAPSPTGEEVQISEYSLHPAYPNPFNPETRITYDVLEAGHVNLRVFDILGREVARLVDSDQPKGRYSTIFNAHDLPSGLYFYRINIGGKYTSTQKMLLLK